MLFTEKCKQTLSLSQTEITQSILNLIQSPNFPDGCVYVCPDDVPGVASRFGWQHLLPYPHPSLKGPSGNPPEIDRRWLEYVIVFRRFCLATILSP